MSLQEGGAGSESSRVFQWHQKHPTPNEAPSIIQRMTRLYKGVAVDPSINSGPRPAGQLVSGEILLAYGPGHGVLNIDFAIPSRLNLPTSRVNSLTQAVLLSIPNSHPPPPPSPFYL